VRLEVKVHIVTGSTSSAQEHYQVLLPGGSRGGRNHLGQLASAESTLTPEETEIGAALVDIGGGTSDIAIFTNRQHQVYLGDVPGRNT